MAKFLLSILAAVIAGVVLWIIIPKDQTSKPEQDTSVTAESSIDMKNKTIEKPSRFDINDPKLINMRKYDLRKDIGSKINIGSCPVPPCLSVTYIGQKPNTDPPKISCLLSNEDVSGVKVTFQLRTGCGFTVQTNNVDFEFEIQEDRIHSLSAFGAVLHGSYEKKGLFIKESGCNPKHF